MNVLQGVQSFRPQPLRGGRRVCWERLLLLVGGRVVVVVDGARWEVDREEVVGPVDLRGGRGGKSPSSESLLMVIMLGVFL